MSTRLNIQEVDPAAYQPMFALEKYIHSGELGEALLALVKTRASQINHCAFCLYMLAEEGRKAVLQQSHLDVLAGWPEAPNMFSTREREAIEFTEEVTQISA